MVIHKTNGEDSEERFRLLVESVGDYAIFMLDPRGYISSWNRGAERLKLYKADEIVGQHFSKFYSDEEVRSGKCEFELRVAAEDGRFEDEGHRIRKDGSKFWASVVITAMRDPRSGELVGFAKVTRDLTDRKTAEEQRLELIKAKEAVQLRDEFISIASHELRTPLSTLRIQADSIVRSLRRGSVDVERLAGRAEMVSSQVARLERLVNSVLDVSRVSAGRLRLQPERVELGAIVRNVINSFADELARARCEVELVAEEPVFGDWDPSGIDQVVTNLLTNAAKYGAGKPISVRVYGDEHTAHLTLHDHGIGVAEENHARIFERFERAVDARHFGGLGLGLWLTKQLVEAHGGTIGVASELGQGASFTVELPKVRQ